MKILTTTQKVVYTAQGEKLQQINFHLFGRKFWTENHFYPKEVKTDEELRKESHDLEEMAMYLLWRERHKLGGIDNEKFEQILTTKF